MSAQFKEINIQGTTIKAIAFRLCKLEIVNKLPPITSEMKAPRFVYWKSSDEDPNANGDGQVWAWYPGASYYVPLQRMSYHNGVPEST